MHEQGRRTPVFTAGEGDAAVLFTAGPQVRPAMARALYGTFPAFRDRFDEVSAVLDRRLPLPLAAVVFAPEGGHDARLLRRGPCARAALFAYEAALYRLWQEWGIRVGAVAGDGIGALAAAHAAGALGLQEAARCAVAGRRVRSAAHAERALCAAGFRLLLVCGPGRFGTGQVGHLPALLAELAELQLCGPRIDFTGLFHSARL
ncbi:acyltransferase domain-containing protein [Streptomyces sp. NPDC005423]|uniref:acyltransferase domain-containing protein n=1 Tax=Streptomyces sp. NPDC005423 TaxID=3155343 RepID=UPI0033B2138B